MTYDLEERTEKFAKDVRLFVKKLSRSIANDEDIRQLIRASGSVAANYIEANEAISKKDFYYRIRVCRKESKESRLFLRLVETGSSQELEQERERLTKEATEFILIFNKILKSDEPKN
jgi:four helix bundle protein